MVGLLLYELVAVWRTSIDIREYDKHKICEPGLRDL